MAAPIEVARHSASDDSSTQSSKRSRIYWGSLLLGDDELRLQPLVHFLSPAQGFLYVVADVFFSDYLGELGLVDQLRGLFAGAAEDQRPFAGVQLLGDVFQGEEAGSVEGGHVAKAQDHDRRQLVQVLGDDGDFVCRAEQERAVDAEDGGVVGNVFVLENVHAAIFNVVVGDLREGGGG